MEVFMEEVTRELGAKKTLSHLQNVGNWAVDIVKINQKWVAQFLTSQ